jgi:hypothetical protein
MRKIILIKLVAITLCFSFVNTAFAQEKYGIFVKEGDNGKYGYVDAAGKVVIPFKFEYASEFHDYYSGKLSAYTTVNLNEKYNYIDITGETISPKWYSDQDNLYADFEDDAIPKILRSREKRLLEAYKERGIDVTIKEILKLRYNYAILRGEDTYYEVNLYGAYEKGGTGICDLEGNIVIPCKYDDITKYNDYYGIILNEKNGACDLTGKEIVPCKYTYLLYYKEEELFHVVSGGRKKDKYDSNPLGGKHGRLDKNGKEIVPCKYDAIGTLSEGLFTINIDGKWGYIDLKGNVIIKPQYSSAESFQDGMAMVAKDGSSFLISNPLKSGGSKTLASLSTKTGQTKSDVDTDIPVSNRSNSETFVFIIANENYDNLSVPFAINDGSIFKEYCIKTLGIPEKNIRLEEDATSGKMISVINRMKEIADAFDGDAKLIFYYTGQGAPDEKNNQAYLLPTDGSVNNIASTGYSIAKLNEELGALNVKSAVVFLDACFNGAKRDGKMIASARGVAVKVKKDAAQGNVVLFNASSADEAAQQHPEQGHGLFTYYLLKKLQEKKGDVTLKELGDYLISNVKQQSVSSGNSTQTPVIVTSDKTAQQWQNIKL